MVEKEWSQLSTRPLRLKMLPQYQTQLQNRLNPTQYLTLLLEKFGGTETDTANFPQLLVGLLQFHKQVRIERLAALFPQPILYESRRRNLQRFLKLPQLSVALLWFPIIEHLIKTYFPKSKRLYVAIDRTQWKP